MENVLQEADIAMCISNSEGNSDCCIRLAEHYHVKGEYEQAFHWYCKAAELPDVDPNVYFNIGYAYQHGEGCKSDLSAAYHWYVRAAENHVPQAMYNLAFFYQNGLVVTQSEEKAIYYLQMASLEMQRMVTKSYGDTQRIKDLQHELLRYQSLSEELHKAVEAADLEKQKYLSEISNLKCDFSHASAELTRCQSVNDELRKAIEATDKEKQKYISELSKLNYEFSHVSEELTSQKAKCRESDSQRHDLESRCSNLDKQLADKGVRLEILEDQNASAVSTIKQMEQKFSDQTVDYEKKLRECRQSFEEMNKRLVDENRFIAAKLNYNAGLISQFEALLERSFVRKIQYVKIVNQLKYDKVIPVDDKELYLKVSQYGKWGIINQRGKICVPLDWDEIGTYSNTLTAVRSGNLWGYINRTGKVVLTCQWEMAYSFNGNVGCVMINGIEKKINKKGKILD